MSEPIYLFLILYIYIYVQVLDKKYNSTHIKYSVVCMGIKNSEIIVTDGIFLFIENINYLYRSRRTV